MITSKIKHTVTSIYRLKSLIRFNTSSRLKDESVAEHSFFVAIYSLLIATEVSKFSTISIEKVLTMALIHDVPEINLSDIPHDVKKRLNVYDILERLELESFSSTKFRDIFKELSEKKSLESQIVHYADILSVKVYTLSEISLGNTTLKKIDLETDARLDKFTRLNLILKKAKFKL